MRLIPGPHSRQPIAVSLAENMTDLTQLTLDIRYLGDGGAVAGVALDRKIIPAIIKAVNNHDALVEAVNLLQAAHKSYSNEFNPSGKVKDVADWELINRAFVAADTVLAKLKET